MLGLWILGSTAGDDILQEYVAVELISLVETTPYRQQALLHAALWNMLEIEAVRIYFRTLLQTSDDPYILHTIGVLGYRLDAVHLLYKIESRKTP